MPCAACVALQSQSSSVEPHAALSFVGDENHSFGIAGNDSGETYRCTACESYLYRHTGRLDTRIWSWGANPEAPVTKSSSHHDIEGVRAILVPLDFEVKEVEGPWSTWPSAWKKLVATTYSPKVVGSGSSERPLYVEISFPDGPGDIKVGVTRAPGRGNFSGPAYTIRDLDHLRESAAQIVPFFEEHFREFLCPRCRGTKVEETRKKDGRPFFACVNYHNPGSGCDWKGDVEPDQPWPG